MKLLIVRCKSLCRMFQKIAGVELIASQPGIITLLIT